MRRVAVVLTLALALAAEAQDVSSVEWERPFTGYLPDPDAATSVNPRDSWADAIPRAYACYVRDRATGAPVAGARVSHHAEILDGAAIDPAPRLGQTLADLDGLAWIHAADWPGGAHWLVTAPGYAPAHSFTFAPPSTVWLERGEDIEARLLDPMGHAVAGAEVAYFLGCPHAPVARRASTRASGRFTLRDVVAGRGFLWVVSPAGRYVYNSPLYAGRFGERRQDLVIPTGWTARGRLLGMDDRPLGGAVVRYARFPRGPVTATDAEGHFILHGLPEDAVLAFQVNGAVTRFGEWRDRTPFVVRVDRAGQVRRAEPPVRALLRISTTDGSAPGPMDLRLTHLGSGHSWLAESDEDRPHEVVLHVPPGDYEVAPATPFEDVTFRPRRVHVDGAAAIEVPVRRQPRLAIEGELPSLAHEVTLVTPNGEVDCPDRDEPPPVPATGPAVLRVGADIDAPVFFFPVAPVQDGVRRVRVRIPEPHRIRLSSGAPIDFASLRFGRTEPSSFVEDDGVVETYAVGDMQIDIDSSAWEGTRRFDIDLPTRPAELSLSRADARLVTDDDGDDVTAAPAPAGPCAVRLVCLDAEGEPLACAVSVSGVTHWTDEGVLKLSDLPAGAHHVIASPRDPDYAGRELRLVLEAGPARERTIRFSLR